MHNIVLIACFCLTVSYFVFEFWTASRPTRYIPCSNEKLPVELREALCAQEVERKKLGFLDIFAVRRIGRGGSLWGVCFFNREGSAVLVYSLHHLSWQERRFERRDNFLIHVHCPPPVYRRLRIGFESHISHNRVVTVNQRVPLLENIWDYAPDSITQEFDTISSLTAAWEHHRVELRQSGKEPSNSMQIAQTEGLNLLGRVPLPFINQSPPNHVSEA